MARRSDHSREELYEMALTTAREIVEAEGFRALTARNVADAMGYSPGTLYNLFANLDDLVIHLNGRTLDVLHDRLSALKSHKDPERDLRAFAEVYIGFLADHPNLWSTLFEYRLPAGKTLPDWFRTKITKLLGMVEDTLSPLFADDDTAGRAEAARVLWAGLHGICSLSADGKLTVVTSHSVSALANSLVAHYVAGLRARN